MTLVIGRKLKGHKRSANRSTAGPISVRKNSIPSYASLSRLTATCFQYFSTILSHITLSFQVTG